MEKIVCIASNNHDKAVEIATALPFEGWKFKTLDDLGIVSEPLEDADTFEGNARIKALSARSASGGMAVLADDSGLMVDALSGAPGVYSARYSGENATYASNNEKLLKELNHLTPGERSARFVSFLVFIDEDATEITAEGSIEGTIALAPQGENGFGYDPLFLPDIFNGKKSMAELTRSEKAEISHRGNALRDLYAKIAKRL